MPKREEAQLSVFFIALGFCTATLGLGDIEKDYKIIQSGEITIK